MTSTITAGTLTITITEALTLNDSDTNDHGISLTNKKEISNVATVAHQVVTIPTSEVGLLAVATDLATAPAATAQNTYVAGHFDEDDVRYIRITNKDDANHCTLLFRTEGGAEFAVMLDHGMSHIVGVDQANGTVNTMDAGTTALTVALEDLEDITAQANTAAVDLEVVVASA